MSMSVALLEVETLLASDLSASAPTVVLVIYRYHFLWVWVWMGSLHVN
jgi:hypothetical protein